MAKYLETKNIPVEQIELAPWHPRKNVKEAHIEEIGGSLADTYQMSSIRVTPRDGKYLVAFGGRRVTGARAKGLKEIRAEIWDLTDLELINDQVREFCHTESLEGSADDDDFVLFAYHKNVEAKSQLCDSHNCDHDFNCFSCPKQPHHQVEGCPAFLSQSEFSQEIIGHIERSLISRAISRAIFRNAIPEIRELCLLKELKQEQITVPFPRYLLEILYRLFRDKRLDRQETIALAQKTANDELGTISQKQKEQGYRSGLRDKLELVSQYLFDNSLPISVRDDLIHRENYGPAEAERDIRRLKRNAIKIDPPQGKYRTLVIDPPWPIEKIEREVRPNQVEVDYPTLSLEEIADLPIPDLAFEEGCHIYLWTTHKHLHDALHILETWGANYECELTWVKNVGITPFSWMYSTEHCLFARIGNLPLDQKGRRLDFEAKVREHSRKPNEFYKLVKDVSPGPRKDMFGREPHDGFEVWGNEPNKFKQSVAVN